MDSRYPDATSDELGGEGVCIICREEMRPWSDEGVPGNGGRGTGTQDQRHRPKKLPCGHILHFACLRSWLERQQRCPTCRRPVLDENVNANANARNNPAAAMAQGNGLQFQAQWGFGGLQIGMGAGMLGDLMRAQQNQANQPQQPQQQPPQAPQPGAQFPQRDQQQPQTPVPTGDQTQAGDAQTIRALQEQIHLNQQMIERERARVLQRQHTRVQERERPTNTQPTPASADPAAPVGPETGTTPAANIPANPTTANPNTGNGPNFAVPPANFLPTPNPNTPYNPPFNPFLPRVGLPHGMVLPPGWSVVPLTVIGMGGSDPIPAAQQQRPPTDPSGVLAARRGARTYQESMRSYHALHTPTSEASYEDVELGGSSNRPTMHSRTASAPAVSTTTTTITTNTIPAASAPPSSPPTNNAVPEALVQQLDAINDAVRRMREAAQSLEDTARQSVFSVPTPASFAETGERLNLFGEGSMFPLPAQEGALRSLQSEVLRREQEWGGEARGVVEGLLTGEARREAEEDGELVEVPRPTETENEEPAPEATSRQDKGKGVDRGEQGERSEE